MTERMSVKGLARLFIDNKKLHSLLESMISDKGFQIIVNLIRKLNKILGIEIRLLTAFCSQMDGQMECMNQDLEQYLKFFIDHQQKN